MLDTKALVTSSVCHWGWGHLDSELRTFSRSSGHLGRVLMIGSSQGNPDPEDCLKGKWLVLAVHVLGCLFSLPGCTELRQF